jgi:methylglyoxal synthase
VVKNNDKVVSGTQKRIAMVAHDNEKKSLLEWAKLYRDILSRHILYATGNTGSLLETELGIKIKKFQSGPLGGDLQIGALIAAGTIDLLIYYFVTEPKFWLN